MFLMQKILYLALRFYQTDHKKTHFRQLELMCGLCKVYVFERIRLLRKDSSHSEQVHQVEQPQQK